MKKQFENVVWQEGKYYVAQCLNIDISSFGDTKDEALKNLKEAIELFLEDADKNAIAEVTSPEIIHSELNYA